MEIIQLDENVCISNLTRVWFRREIVLVYYSFIEDKDGENLKCWNVNVPRKLIIIFSLANYKTDAN